jgi:hypothetical protein
LKDKPHSRIVFAIAGLAILILLASCQSKNVGSASTSAVPEQKPSSTPLPTQISMPTSTPKVEPTLSVGEIRASISNALFALFSKANRMNNKVVLENGQIRTNIIEFVPSDRKHIIDVDEKVEYIIIGDKVYSKTKTSGDWEETQLSASTFLGEEGVTAQEIGETISNVQLEGKDILDDQAVVIYSYERIEKYRNIELHNHTRIWVGEDDGLPYKMIIDGEIVSVSTDTDTGESIPGAAKAVTTVLINFDPTISIEPPFQQ